jgi:polar amino acid transport system substrate-binding protein
MRLALAVACLCLATPVFGDGLDDLKKRGVLRWGADIQGGEPYVYSDPAQPDKLIGFEVEIAESLARRLGVKAEFVQISWPNLVPGLERGDYDIAMNGLEHTPGRAARILLSRPYYVYGETLAVRKGSPLRVLDLRGRRVGTLSQTYAHELLVAQGAEPVLYEGVQEPYLDLVAGRTEAVLLDNIIADRYGCVMEGVECLPGDVALGSYIIGIRKEDTRLKAAIDEALAGMISDGELQKILERSKIWDTRQLRLAAAANGLAGGEVKADTPRPKRKSFSVGQLLLFVTGAGVTLLLSGLAFALAMSLGLVVAVTRVYGPKPLKVAAALFVELFRGTPVLLQLYVLYFALAPVLKLSAFTAAILGLGLNYAAYEAEIYRGAILAISHGQSEAAHAVGMSTLQTLRHVLVPQAVRTALPAMTNDFVALLKDSSVVSVITVVELTKRMTIAGVDLNDWVVPGIACAVLYLAMSVPLAQAARAMERKLNRDSHPRAH